MGFWGAVTGAIGGFVVGGPIGAVVGGASGYGIEEAISEDSPPPSTNQSPPAIDYSAAMAYASDNNKTTALAQIMSQEFAIQQASVDRQMQLAANLELGIEKLDTKLQMRELEFIQTMTAEQNRHQEKLAVVNTQWQQLGQGGAPSYDDLPPPENET